MLLNNPFNEPTSKAFTRLELIAIVAVLVMMAFLTMPALAHSKNRSAATGCLSTLRQMMVGWEMYKEDNADKLMGNAPAGTATSSGWVPSNAEDWHNAVINTNAAAVLSGLMGPYVGNDVRVFKCPADVIPSDSGQRLRSRSMNGQMAYAQSSTYNPGWRVYMKGSDLICPTPASAWVFCDESPYTINDGYLQLNLNSPSYPDLPANYHGKACGFSFADGHAEDHRWLLSNILSVPVAYGVQRVGTSSWPSYINDVDYFWLRQHSACKP